MIDSANEYLLTLTQAAEGLPRRRRGRKTHVSTLHRWATAGCRGVRLEIIQVGGTRCTSREALQRFFERLSQGSQAGTIADHQPGSPSVNRSAARRRREAAEAGKRLEAMGA